MCLFDFGEVMFEQWALAMRPVDHLGHDLVYIVPSISLVRQLLYLIDADLLLVDQRCFV